MDVYSIVSIDVIDQILLINEVTRESMGDKKTRMKWKDEKSQITVIDTGYVIG